MRGAGTGAGDAAPRGAPPGIHLDHAATSFPKPEAVVAAMVAFLRDVGASPGRSGHRRAAEAARIVFQAREDLAALLGVSDSRRVIFTAGATDALNLALLGILGGGGHVVTTAMDHNSVARPVARLRRLAGVAETVVPADGEGFVDPDRVRDALRPDTRLVVVNHASNVCGALQDLRAIRRAIGGLPLLVDAAQTAGAVPVDVEADGIDLLAFAGHKALLGPPGIGGLALGPGVDLPPSRVGGTGSRSESEEQPDFLPDRLEAGTPNTPGIAGLGAAARLLLREGVAARRQAEMERFGRFLDRLAACEGLVLHGPRDTARRTATASFTVRGLDPGEAALRLDRDHGIAVRAGLHCAPRAHRALGTFPGGTVRVSAGVSTTEAELAAAAEALEAMARR